jgi:hypothetical protein
MKITDLTDDELLEFIAQGGGISDFLVAVKELVKRFLKLKEKTR